MQKSQTREKLIPSAAVILQTMAAKYSGTNVQHNLENTGVRLYVDWDVFVQLSEY
jgi:hypothetical protein